MAFGAATRPTTRTNWDLASTLRRARVGWTTFRRDLRLSETPQIFACAILGCFIGAIVDLLRRAVGLLHSLDFGIPAGSFLSAGIGIERARILVVPVLGGLVLGLITFYMRRHRSAEIVDPIEANALYGGRMSFRDSFRLVVTTLISNAAGASVGMEAGYSQLGAGIFSRVGQYFGLRRADLRLFVTAGAGAAIAAAFNAPFAGAFYGYELVLSSYVPKALAPVAAAALCAALTQGALTDMPNLFAVTHDLSISPRSYWLFGAMGILAAGIAVAAMQAVTWTERGLRRTNLPSFMRPAVGGLVLSALAYYWPQVLGGGHGAIQLLFDEHWALLPLLALLAAKLIASAISIGSGFRGGLFSSALFLGCLFGAAFAHIVIYFAPEMSVARSALMLAGMASVAAAIVGGPLTMVFLVLEGTGDFRVTVGVLFAVIVASTIVRLTFGYSFATWRFHLRGLAIRSAHDVGWISDLTVGRLMRSDPKIIEDKMSLRALRERYPPGGAKRLFVVDEAGRYVGLIEGDMLHDAEIDATEDFLIACDLAGRRELFLTAGENIRTALVRFEESRTEALPVLDSSEERHVVGYMTEAYALRRYNEELERMHSAELGQQDLFSLGRPPGS